MKKIVLLLLLCNLSFSFSQVLIVKPSKNYVVATIKNDIDKEFYFFSMYCNWSDFFYTNDKSITIIKKECNLDYYVMIHLKPNESKSFILSFDKHHYKNSPFKIGMDLQFAKKVEKTDVLGSLEKYSLTRTKNIIWSDFITF